MKKVQAFKCKACDHIFMVDTDCKNHEKICRENMNLPWKWLRVLKKYRNNHTVYFVKTLKKITKTLEDDIAEYVGENTDGGHNSWMEVYVTRAKNVPKKRIYIKSRVRGLSDNPAFHILPLPGYLTYDS
jgi:hypothetical protein